MDNLNWRANWMDKWGRRISSLEPTQPDPRLLAKEAQKLAEKEARERVDKALQAHADMTEETKRGIKAVMAEAQARIGFAPDSPKLTLVPTKPQGISRLNFFLKKFVRAKPKGEDVTRTAPSARESILTPGTFRCTNETVESLVERALKDRKNAGIGAAD